MILGGCIKKKAEDPIHKDLPQLIDAGELTAVTLYSSTSYFEYRMQEMGYEYELIKDFAQTHNLTLNLKIAENSSRLIEMLLAGEANVVAYPIQVDNELKENVLYTGQERQSAQVLIQRSNRGDTILTDVTQLIGREVYLQAGTPYAQRLNNLNDELGGGILIRHIEKDTITTEDLIGMVSRGEIPYTVSDEMTARLNKTYHWNINLNLPVSFPQRASWIVSRQSPLLAAAIDEWAEGQIGQQSYRAVTKRYFELSKQPYGGVTSAIQDGHISPYDHLFKKYAPDLGWDWQLLASIAFQESTFNPLAVSWAGAEGLMGIMPGTARAFGVSPHEVKDPEISIQTSVRVLKNFRRRFENYDSEEEVIKLTLASYNAGVGHVYDAQILAEKIGKDPTVWDDNVSEGIRMKSDPQYYNDPDIKHGYLRATETLNYVYDVMNRYAFYKEATEEP
ncbi:transglycosylase SLT domain-containing protein [Parabacteroides sp. PFB2-10]|uniref:transglycosylase SLT domain-containing protein n=1 Tax=Parabacteroides sp. PFB2-10 TaxID=1742405 RepID=UPI0032AFB085